MNNTLKNKSNKKQTKQLMLWIGALAIGAVLGILGIAWLNGLMNFIATVYTRLFQLLAVPTIALAVMTTLASLGNQADTGKIFRHALKTKLYESISEYNLYLCKRIVPEQVLSCRKRRITIKLSVNKIF